MDENVSSSSSVETLLKPMLDAGAPPMMDGAAIVSTAPIVVVGGLGLTYALVRVGVHFKLQFAVADALTRVTPRGATLIQLGSDTKNLYYYPKDTKLVVCVAPDVNENLVNRVGIETGVVVLPRSTAIAGKSADGDLFWGQPRESVDAVVTTGALSELSPEEVKMVAKKAAAALKPGGRFIFVEPAGGERGQGLFDAIEATMAFESPVEFDDGWATQPLFPHAVGVAIKKETVEDSTDDSKRAGLRSRRRAK